MTSLNNNNSSDTLTRSSEAGGERTPSNQVEPVLETVGTSVVNETGFVANFVDENPRVEVALDGKNDATASVSTFVDDKLEDFFHRKIRVGSYKWVDDTYMNEVIDTAAYWRNPAVKNKLQNFELISYTLHVEVIINATPFHYSKLFLSGRPCARMTEAHSPNQFLDNSITQLLKVSQLYHVKSDVSTNSTMEMELPFIYPRNYQPISDLFVTVPTYTASPWEVRLNSSSPLHFANPTSSVDVTVGVYVWASDVELTVPTSVLQSGSKTGKNPRNKYIKGFQAAADNVRTAAGVKIDPKEIADREGGGFISNTMSTASSVLAMAEKVPVIGSYAGVARGVTTGIGSVASIFGFSRPVADITQDNVKTKAISNLFSTATADGVDKLALDPTQGVCIDPGIVGGTGLDEMAFAGIKQKETLFTTLLWFSSADVDDELMWANVTPLYCTVDSVTSRWAVSSLGFLAIPFSQWSGSIKYRFEIIKSQYHNGRIRISYEPSGAPLNSDMNTAYSKVVDISTTSDFEFSVPWSQPEPYKSVSPKLSQQYYIAPGGIKNYNPDLCNGIIYVSVVNELTSPDDSTPIYVNVYISGGEDFEVAVPSTRVLNTLSHIPIPDPVAVTQSDEVTLSTPDMSTSLFGSPTPPDVVARKKEVFNGESYASFRALLKRYARGDSIELIGGGELPTLNNYLLRIFPYGHSEPSGISPNLAPMSLLELVTHSYGFYRGSIRQKFCLSNPSQVGTFTAKRSDLSINRFTESKQTTSITTVDVYNLQMFKDNNVAGQGNTWDGMAYTEASVLPSLEVEFPYYDQHRFNPASWMIDGDRQYDSFPTNSSRGFELSALVLGESTFSFVDRFFSTGEDFSTYFYMGPAPLYKRHP